jgi:hypothetical protein
MSFPIKKNTATTIYLPGLLDRLTGQLRTNPTLAAADCKYSLDGGAFTAFGTTPDVYPASGTQVRIQLAAAETNGSSLTIRFQDAAGNEWNDVSITYEIVEATMDDIDDAVDTKLTAMHGSGAWNAAGTGETATTITINADGLPVDGVHVWITTDLAGANIIWSGTTNDMGQATMYLDAGTYYCWKQLAGYEGTNPETFTVT